MRLEFRVTDTNVVRFPIQWWSAPSLPLLRDVAPDPLEVALVAQAFRFPQVMGVGRLAGHKIADAHLRLRPLPNEPIARAQALAMLLEPFLVKALHTCARAEHLVDGAAKAQREWHRAMQVSKICMPDLGLAADEASRAALHAYMAAYQQCETAEGAAGRLEAEVGAVQAMQAS